jgi:serine/threonine protein kinase
MALKVSGGGGGAEPTMSTARIVDVKDRYEIDSGKPLPDFDSQPAVAYSCSHKRDSKRNLYALVCDPKLPPRFDVVSVLRRIDHRNLIRALDWDVVDWPPEGRRCPVVILERPVGKRVMASLETVTAPMQEERVTRHFIEPICQILREMHALGTHHRMIRPDNLFWMNDEQREILIGECFSAPAGVTSPIVYETLECSLAYAAGRGEGGPENDLYAVGVTILALLTGQSPLIGKSDDEIIRLKLNVGSYAAMVQNHRVSLTMMEPLRGLLNDHPDERWTVEELSLWLNGRRLSPKQQAMPTKGSRALTVAGMDLTTSREIAHVMHRNWDQAIVLVNSGALDTWLRRSLGEDDRVEAVNLAKSIGNDNQDRLVARVLIALDPDGPIRLRDFSATLEGISSLIGAFADDAQARQLFGQVISFGLVNFWLDQQRGMEPSHIRQMNRLDKVKPILNQTGLGFGMERVVYELNGGLPCLSPLFERDFVATIEHLLPAMERLCASDDRPQRLIDRHIAAFLGTNFKRAIGGELRDIDRAADEEEGRIAQVRILSNLQDALHRNVTFPHLCAFSAALLEPAVERFHSRERRKSVRSRLRKVAKSGRLKDLLDIIDDTQEVAKDQTAFDKACMDYAKSTRDLINLMHDINNKGRLAEELGGQLAGAAALLGCVATVALAGFATFF